MRQFLPEAVIPDFPDYVVDTDGRVINDAMNRVLRPSVNQQGVLKVSMTHRRVVGTRAINKLVATAFVPNPNPEEWTAVIHLNGDKTDCRAENLAWRPRWFAWEYTNQFTRQGAESAKIFPVHCDNTGEDFPTIYHAATTYGELWNDVFNCCYGARQIFPHGHVYRSAKDVGKERDEYGYIID